MKKKTGFKYFFSDTSDVSVVNFEDIVRKLPQPQLAYLTSCTATTMPFNTINFDRYKFR